MTDRMRAPPRRCLTRCGKLKWKAAFFVIGKRLKPSRNSPTASCPKATCWKIIPTRTATRQILSHQETHHRSVPHPAGHREAHRHDAQVFFRPPVGLSNPNVFHAATALRLKVIGWSIRSLDTRLTDPERIVQRIERGLKPGAIILLHDGNIPAERLVVTVKLLLTKLREHGYEVVRLDRMLG